jgi:hypothetical protein
MPHRLEVPMNHVRMILLAVVLMMRPAVDVLAQDDFGDFFNSADPEFMKLKTQTEERFAKMTVLDAEFAGILNRAWKELELSTGIPADSEPKPHDIPTARLSEKPPAVKPQEAEPVPGPEPVSEITPETIARYGSPVTYFRTMFPFKFDPALNVPLNGVSEASISKYWESMSSADYKSAVTLLIQVRSQLALNDWGYCTLLDRAAETVCGADSRERPLFIWFMLVKSGYDARIGFSGDLVYVLLPSREMMYNTPYYDFNGIRYFLTRLGGTPETVTALYTYEGSYKEANQHVEFSMPKIPDISKALYEKPFSFTYDGKEYTIKARVNRNMVDFFDTYPQTDLGVYFAAATTGETAQSLKDGLVPLIEGRKTTDAVNLLLRFVQTAFPYKTDGDQFGREKFMFPEETLYYPYSDCEDRSFLFAYLVDGLLKLDVVGLDYPGHVATAVHFPDIMPGDAVEYEGTRYVICDPTYINAEAGECMPSFKNVAPKIVKFSGTRQGNEQ